MAAGAVFVIVTLCRRGTIRDRHGAEASARSEGTKPAAWIGCAAVACGGWLVGGSIALAALGGDPDNPSLLTTGLVYWAAAACGLAGAIAGEAMFLGGAAGRGARPRWVDALRGAGVFALTLPVVWTVSVVARVVMELASGGPPPPIAHEMLGMMLDDSGTLAFWVCVGAVVIAAPVIEETIYRRHLQTGLARIAGSDWIGIVGASCVFVLMHATAVPMHMLPSLLALSLGLGLAMERTGRVWVPIVAHAAFNAWNVGLAMWLA